MSAPPIQPIDSRITVFPLEPGTKNVLNPKNPENLTHAQTLKRPPPPGAKVMSAPPIQPIDSRITVFPLEPGTKNVLNPKNPENLTHAQTLKRPPPLREGPNVQKWLGNMVVTQCVYGMWFGMEICIIFSMFGFVPKSKRSRRESCIWCMQTW